MCLEPVKSFFLAVCPIAVGLLLIAAAFAKVRSPGVASEVIDAALGTPAPAWAVLALSVGELCLGVALLVPTLRSGAMPTAAVFFVGAIGVLVLARARGHAGGCGCFGRFSPSINATVALDGAIVAACGLWFLVFSERRDRHAEDPLEDRG
ncbi:MAG: hypothetical protein DHS20C14_03600 [Phycisphaeraceae bacterium]|nr:MAG: hypothetical protein DHS20C14_03600 [Phycisphaeraceae bacterium]